MNNKDNCIKQDNIGSHRNCTIDILRLCFSILVVAIHTSPFIEYSKMVSYFFSQAISRLAVPFFSAVAGYFFFVKSDSNFKDHLKTVLKYLIIYSFWSALMFIFDAIRWEGKPLTFVIYVLKTFFLTGWHHYWYLLAIIYTLIILAVANAVSKKANVIIYYFSFALLAIGIAVSNYGNVLGNFPVLNFFKNHSQDMFYGLLFIVIPFFMMGYGLNMKKKVLNARKPLLVAIACALGLLVEIIITTHFELHSNVVLCLFTYPTVYFLIIWALNNPHQHLRAIARYCAGIATVIYLGHNVIAIYMQSRGCAETITFFVSILITAAIGLILTKIDNPVIRKLI